MSQTRVQDSNKRRTGIRNARETGGKRNRIDGVKMYFRHVRASYGIVSTVCERNLNETGHAHGEETTNKW